MPTFTALDETLRRLSTIRSPRLTWYGDERIELSGATVSNWVTKTTNLLVEELDAGPGTLIGLDLPVHWRQCIWALATWQTGATLAMSTEGDIVVTDTPEHAAAHDVIAVALPALARSFPRALSPETIDAAADVMTYADQPNWTSRTQTHDLALVTAATRSTYGDLAARPRPASGRRLIDGRQPAVEVLLRCLDTWRADGSVVLTSPVVAAQLAATPDRRAALVASERIDIEPEATRDSDGA